VTQGGNLKDRLEAVEREMILSALERYDGIQTRAAESLGISERVLRYKIKKFRTNRTAEPRVNVFCHLTICPCF
jgi:transcriptional regulator with PAS, ATPase and Fis domain